MTGNKSMFKKLDESKKIQVTLGDNKQIQVESKGTVGVKINHGKMKLLYNVYFVPNLAHNLLSIGQLMAGGYKILFDNDVYVINDKKTGQPIVSVQMTENKMFPLKISSIENQVLVVSEKNEFNTWHLRYGHLNVKGLKLLSLSGYLA
ncbi:Retrovirus-related Pol polyprotein from transposon TNT 1-94 [Apostasia shenzhenica]|uniref:Retrovirus-related Pol polyprotein from transposon TNT 1-94 n=1 Tax=Apostasia shenzhenica TaxID=1088818 RepID=A0A2I0AZ26_9ASPA|nr:Retrovirus-related Pol polyprotein from transposon TNT 1-94 [Apostasia shenzhenica]